MIWKALAACSKLRKNGACTKTRGRDEVPLLSSYTPLPNFSPLSHEAWKSSDDHCEPPCPPLWGALGCPCLLRDAKRSEAPLWQPAPPEPGCPIRCPAPFQRDCVPPPALGPVHPQGCSSGVAAWASRHSDVPSWRQHLTPSLFIAHLQGFFGFSFLFFLVCFFFFFSDKSVISPVPYKTHQSDLLLQKVNDKEFYLALAMGTLKKRFLCYICFHP